MTVPALPTFADGVLTNAAMLNSIVSNIQALYTAAMGPDSGPPGYNTAKKPQVVLRVTGTKSMTSGSEHLVLWDTPDVNTDAMWTTGSGNIPGTITVQTAGTYRISTQIGVGSNSDFHTGGLLIYLCVNGTVTASNTVACWRDSWTVQNRCSATLSLLPGSTIFVVVQQNYGSSRNLTTAPGCRFEAVRIGPA